MAMPEPTLISLPLRPSSSSSKKRIRVACDLCRRKKVKCDGGYPCSNCLQAGESDCHYKERPKRGAGTNKKPKRASTIKTLEQLDTRMQKLESSISLIVSRLQSIVPQPTVSPITRKPSAPQSAESGSEDMDDDVDEDDENDDEDDDDQDDDDDNDDDDEFSQDNNSSYSSPTYQNNLNKLKTGNAAKNESKEDSQKKDLPRRKSVKNILYTGKFDSHFGNHSFLGIFSLKSLQWILKSLGPEHADVVAPFFRFPFTIQRKMKHSIQRWIDIPSLSPSDRARLDNPFPENPDLVFAILDTYYEKMVLCRILVPTISLKKLFESYYGLNGQRKRKLKSSELLMMTVGLAFCLCCKVECENRPLYPDEQFHEPPVIASLDAKTALDLQNTYLDNAIYYYHRISVISEGVESVEAILLLVMYVEISWFSSHVNFILCSTAIRYAQELGFHRAESYEGLPEELCTRRRKLWWFCYYYDLEICFRTGKPPVINSSDVSNHFGPDVGLSPFSVISPDSMLPVHLMNDHLTFPEVKASFDYLNVDDELVSHHYYFALLTRLRSRSYKSLFMASAKIDTFASLSAALDEINSEMFELRQFVPEDSQPFFYNHPSFKQPKLVTLKDDSILSVQLSYFFLLMTVNRIPLLVCTSDYDENSGRGLNYKNLSLDSARTILTLVQNFTSRSSLAFFNWIAFFPLSAFLNLLASIINHPASPDVKNDLNLLIDSSMNFFSLAISLDNSKRSNIQQNEDELIAAIIKLMLRVVITMVEVKTGAKVRTEKIDKHIMSALDQLPDLGRNTGPLYNITGSSPFSVGVNKHIDSSISSRASETDGASHAPEPFSITTEVNGVDGVSSENNPSPNINSLFRMALPNDFMDAQFGQHQLNTIQDYDLGATGINVGSRPFEHHCDYLLYDQVMGLPNFFFDNSLGSNPNQNL